MTEFRTIQGGRGAAAANANGAVAVDPAKLEAFIGHLLTDLGGAFTAPLVSA